MTVNPNWIPRINAPLIMSCLLFVFSCREEAPPNILFILIDDLGWNDLGCYGSEFYETPNIDRLASKGMRFTQAYAANPVCSPTRASIMTGKYPTRIGITDWIPGMNPENRKLLGPDDLHALPLEETTLAEAFKPFGYNTFIAGKWHLGSDGYFPEDQGFDINKGGHEKGSPPGGYYTPYNNPKLEDGPEGEYLTDRLTTESIRFMKNNPDDPFLVFLSFYTVHTPIQANKQYIEKFEQKLAGIRDNEPDLVKEHNGLTLVNQVNPDYASMIYALDQNVGRLMSYLEETGIFENTIIVFTSDNGGLSTLPEHRMIPPTSVSPLRAGKGWCYEGGIRVPLIISWPGKVDSSTTKDTPVISNDFYPTLLDLAGLPLLPEQHQDGISLLPLLSGKDNLNREALFWHYPHYHGSSWTPGTAVRQGDWKLIEFYHWEKTELYNLRNDPGEQNDLAADFPDKVKELEALLEKLQERTYAKMPVSNPEYGAD